MGGITADFGEIRTAVVSGGVVSVANGRISSSAETIRSTNVANVVRGTEI